MKRIYVSGPYTKGDPCINTNIAIGYGNFVLDNGHVPFVPHLSHFWHTATPRDYEDWMKIDFAFVEVCHALVRIPGPSSGADREIEHAILHGIPVFYTKEDLLEWMKHGL